MLQIVLLMALALPALANPQLAGAPPPGSDLPDLPAVVAEDFPLPVREKIRTAHAAATANPLDPSAVGRLGMILHAYQPADQRAELCYKRAHLLAPSTFRWTYYGGVVQAARGKHEEAIPTLRAALRLDPSYLPAQLKLGESLLASGSGEESRQWFEEIVRTHPDSAQAYYGLGRAQSATRNLEEAVRSLNKACQLFPYFGAAHYALALAYQRLGRKEEAREELALYEKNKYDIPGAGDRLQAEINDLYTSPAYLLELGVDFARQGKLELAAVQNEKALETDPQLVRAHINLISLYGRLNQFAKAAEHYHKAVSLDMNSAESHYNYGVLLKQQGRYDEAREPLLRTLEIDPQHAEARYNLGDLLQRQGKLSDAAEEFRKAIASRPGFAEAHFNLGRLLVNQGKVREGIEEFLKALGSEETQSRLPYLYALGAAYARAGERENALSYLHRARQVAGEQNETKLLDAINRDLVILEGRRPQ
jgi:tetratricopeptide (TPR) repeat protein